MRGIREREGSKVITNFCQSPAAYSAFEILLNFTLPKPSLWQCVTMGSTDSERSDQVLEFNPNPASLTTPTLSSPICKMGALVPALGVSRRVGDRHMISTHGI